MIKSIFFTSDWHLGGHKVLVGVTANNYTPVSLSQIKSWIAKYGK